MELMPTDWNLSMLSPVNNPGNKIVSASHRLYVSQLLDKKKKKNHKILFAYLTLFENMLQKKNA